MAAEKSAPSTPSKGQAWFCTTGLPSDVVVEVDDMTFHLHKFPLMSKSKKLHDLIKAQETKQVTKQRQEKQSDDIEESSEEDDEEVPEQEQCHVSFSHFPGGTETFETAAKFCYGVKIDLTAAKVGPLRCAGEVLEMTEEYSEDNLISKTERFLTNSVLKNIKDSIKALKSCENLTPLAENLGIVERCINAVSSKASLYDPTLFGWPVNDVAAASSGESRKSSKVKDGWVEDLAQLSSPLFNRVISSMKEKEVTPEVIESCLIHYTKRWFPGISRSNRKRTSSSMMMASEAEQRQMLETIISNFPQQMSSKCQAVTRFLFGLLRTANILNASDSCKSTLEKKIGAQLELATLDDLLIPSYSYLTETLYDVDCVERILGHFLTAYAENGDDGRGGDQVLGHVRSPAIMLVGKLIDGYLSEIASDSNLKPTKFIELALSLPEKARLYDDGVYRAVDVYLKAHQWLPEDDRERISGVMDCQKLTLEACTHAAQNERLPLRAVVQVLFFEQLQLRHAIAGTLLTADGAVSVSPRPSAHDEEEEEEEDNSLQTGRDKSNNNNTWREAIRENQVLRLDMDSMRTRVHELERECSTMKKVIKKIDKVGTSQSWTSNLTRKFGCKFKTQVCDSHESAVVEASKGRHHQNNQR